MRQTEAELLANLQSLTTNQFRTLNRYYLHPRGQRICKKCLKIYDDIRASFHIKKYIDNEVFYNVHCRDCFNKASRERIVQYRTDPATFIASKFSSYKCRANQEQIPFDLDKQYLIDLWNQQKGCCHYTGIEIDFTLVRETNAPHLLQPSLDKINPIKGYTKGNVVWTAYVINRMKNDLDYEEFITACQLVLEKHANR